MVQRLVIDAIKKGYLSKVETLGYNPNYKLFYNNAMNKDNQNLIKINSKRKVLTFSALIYQAKTFSDSNTLLPPNNI